MNHKTNYTPFMIILAVIGLIACVKEAPIGDKTIEFTYEQTQCADPWGYGNTDSLTVQRLYRYIDSTGLSGPMLNITLRGENPAQVCQACTCKTGKVFHISVMATGEKVQQYKQAGFNNSK